MQFLLKITTGAIVTAVLGFWVVLPAYLGVKSLTGYYPSPKYAVERHRIYTVEDAVADGVDEAEMEQRRLDEEMQEEMHLDDHDNLR